MPWSSIQRIRKIWCTVKVWYEHLVWISGRYFPKKSNFVMSQLDQYFAAFTLFITPITSKCAKSIWISPVMSFQFLILEYHFKGLHCRPSERILPKNISFVYILVYSFIVEVLLHTPRIPSGCDIVTEETKLRHHFVTFLQEKYFMLFREGKCTMYHAYLSKIYFTKHDEETETQKQLSVGVGGSSITHLNCLLAVLNYPFSFALHKEGVVFTIFMIFWYHMYWRYGKSGFIKNSRSRSRFCDAKTFK